MENETDIDPSYEPPLYSSLRYPPPKYKAKPTNPPIASATDFPLLNLPKLNQDLLNLPKLNHDQLNLPQNNQDPLNLPHFNQDRQLNQDNAISASRAPTGPARITPQIVVTTNLGSRNKNMLPEQAANHVPFNFVQQDPVDFECALTLSAIVCKKCFVIFGVIALVLILIGDKPAYRATSRRFLWASYIVSVIGIIVGSGLIALIVLTITHPRGYDYDLSTTQSNSLNFSTVPTP